MTPSTAPPAAAAPADAALQADTALPGAPHECLAFKLGAEEYGIDILRVQEIRSYEQPTRIAGAPECVKGVINLRGTIVPIVDLRLRLRLEPVHYDAFTVVIVLEVGRRIVGIVVDAVSDVVSLQPQQLRPAPALGAAAAADHLLAIAAVDQRMLILLDIDKLMAGAEMGLLQPGAGRLQ